MSRDSRRKCRSIMLLRGNIIAYLFLSLRGFAVLLLAVSPALVHATVRPVPSAAYPTIQSGIDAAANGDTDLGTLQYPTLLPTAPFSGASRIREVDATHVPSDVSVNNDGLYYAHTIPLTYATPDFILDKLNLYVPDTESLILKQGEIAHNGVKIEGIASIIPERYDNSLLMFATNNGFEAMKALIKSLDNPSAVKAALRGRFIPRLRVVLTLLGGPISARPVRMASPTQPSGKRVPIYLQPWGQAFPILLRVTNSSTVLQSFTAYGCSWIENWQARVVGRHSKDEVRVGEPVICAWNPLQTITLKPGESYRKQTIVSIHARGKYRVRIQVGFVRSPAASGPISGQPNRIFWSNKVTAPITEAYGR